MMMHTNTNKTKKIDNNHKKLSIHQWMWNRYQMKWILLRGQKARSLYIASSQVTEREGYTEWGFNMKLHWSLINAFILFEWKNRLLPYWRHFFPTWTESTSVAFCCCRPFLQCTIPFLTTVANGNSVDCLSPFGRNSPQFRTLHGRYAQAVTESALYHGMNVLAFHTHNSEHWIFHRLHKQRSTFVEKYRRDGDQVDANYCKHAKSYQFI